MTSKSKSSIRAACPSSGRVACAGAIILIAASVQAQNLFVATSSGDIYEFTPGGTRSTFATGLAGPVGLAFNSMGDLFYRKLGSRTINEFTPGRGQASLPPEWLQAESPFTTRAISLKWIGPAATDVSSRGTEREAPLPPRWVPVGLARNSAGDRFEADFYTGDIYEFTPRGVRSSFARGLSGPMGLAFNNAGDLFEADYYSGDIYEFTPGGTRSTFATGLSGPVELAFQPVPEPSAVGLLAVGLSGITLSRRHVKWFGMHGR
ncbi:MAG: PEP-CTERM sorting domain-containing protein [Verrucomicrobiia bacterium]